MTLKKKALYYTMMNNFSSFFIIPHLLNTHCSTELTFYVNFIREQHHPIFTKVYMPCHKALHPRNKA